MPLPDKIPDTIYVAFGVIAGALITTMLSRGTTVSGYRQAWINSVRDNFSLLLSNLDIYFEAIIEKIDTMNDDGIKKETAAKRSDALHQVHKIKLFLNKAEKEHKDIIEDINSLIEAIGQKLDRDSYTEQRNTLTTSMQNILKTEWNRVRDGEFLWKAKKLIKYLQLKIKTIFCSKSK